MKQPALMVFQELFKNESSAFKGVFGNRRPTVGLRASQGEFIMQNRISIRSFRALSGFALAMVLVFPALGESQSARPEAFVSFGLEGAVGAANHVLIPDEVSITAGAKVAFQM